MNGDPGSDGQAPGGFFICFRELSGADLLGEIEVPVDVASNPDRHPQERVHRWVLGGESEAVRVGVEVSQSQRLRLDDQQPQDPSAFGQRADLRSSLIVNAHRVELRENSPGFVEHAQCPIAGIDQCDGRLHDLSQDHRQREIGLDEQDGVEQAVQPLGIVEGVIRHEVRLRGHDEGVAIRVFLLDDHELVRRGVRDLLFGQDDLEVVGEASTVAEAVERIPTLKPNVAVLDVRLPDGDGVQVCREIRSNHPEVACLMLTSYADDEALFSAIMAGAAGYVLKQIRGIELVDAIRKVAGGGSLLDPLLTARVMERLRAGAQEDAGLAKLSEQERRILDLISEGLTNRQIADRMYLAEKTVKNYVSNLLAKLGMARRSEAAAYAARLGWHKGQAPGA
jgi:two-component system, NarL family, response regulator DevR